MIRLLLNKQFYLDLHSLSIFSFHKNFFLQVIEHLLKHPISNEHTQAHAFNRKYVYQHYDYESDFLMMQHGL